MIIATKLYIPQTRTAIVNRPRLMERLEAGLDCKLTLVTASAGYGKTTLLTQWATVVDHPLAWVSLDQGDNDVVRFWRHTVAAIKHVMPAFDESAVLSFVNADRSGNMLVAALINGLNRLSETTILVWDDFHHVTEQSILQGIAYLLEHLPVHIHIYMTSRALTTLSLSKMRLGGMLNQLETEDLRFTPKEIADFFDSCHEITLSVQDKDVLLQQTEGWIAGMRLAVLSLDGQAKRDVIVKDMMGRHQDISAYFFEEVFSHLTDKMQFFLLRTSLLERINAELCQAVTDLPDCQTYLLQLEQMNLFLVPLDERRDWYRYHHLFQDFLQVKMRKIQPSQVVAIYEAAGKWFEIHDYTYEAMEYYLVGGHVTEALKLLEQKAPTLMQSELSTLQKWLSVIPDDLLFEKPTLFMNALLSLFLTGETKGAKTKLLWALSRLDDIEAQYSDELKEQFRGGLAVLEIICAFFEGDFESAIHLSEEFVRAYPDGEFFVSFIMDGDVQIPQWELAGTMGSLKKEEHILDRLLKIWSGTNNYFLVADICIGYGTLMYEWNRLGEATYYWRRAKQLGIEHDNAMLTVLADLFLCKVHIAHGEFIKAEDLVAGLKEEVNRRQYSNLSEIIAVHQARFNIAKGNLEQAMSWIKSSDMRSNDEIPSTMLADYELFVYVLSGQGKTSEAAILIERLVHIASGTERMRDRIRLLTHQSLILVQIGEIAKGFDVLEEALALGEPEGYIRTFIDKGKPFMRLLQAYLTVRQKQHVREGKKVSLDYVRQLLALDYTSYDTAATLVKEQIYTMSLTGKEKTIVQFIEIGRSNKEIAHELNISLSTVKTHINNIYGKLRVKNRLQAVDRAKEWNLI